jgi:hypothetical protein
MKIVDIGIWIAGTRPKGGVPAKDRQSQSGLARPRHIATAPAELIAEYFAAVALHLEARLLTWKHVLSFHYNGATAV